MIGLLLRLGNSHVSNVWPRYLRCPSFLALVQDGTIAFNARNVCHSTKL